MDFDGLYRVPVRLVVAFVVLGGHGVILGLIPLARFFVRCVPNSVSNLLLLLIFFLFLNSDFGLLELFDLHVAPHVGLYFFCFRNHLFFLHIVVGGLLLVAQ